MRYYRFQDLVGNDETIKILQRSLQRGTLTNFSIFAGTMGTGKSTCAEIASLFLTCEHPKNDEPCLECETCKNNIHALQNTGKSARIYKINLGRFNSKNDVEKMIHEIFILESSLKYKNVYILEEAHSLPPYLQTSLLEEIDRIAENVYVILCTTKLNALIPELVSRAIVFKFQRLNNSSMTKLLSRYLDSKNCSVDNKMKSLILNNARGIPRNLVNIVDFILNNQITLEELRGFLGRVDDSVFIKLFDVVSCGDMKMIADTFNQTISNYDIKTLIPQLKDFMLRVMFFVTGDVDCGEWSDLEKKSIKEIFPNSQILKLCNSVEKLKSDITDAEFQLFLISCKTILNEKTIIDVVGNRAADVSAQKSMVQRNMVEKKEILQQSQNTMTPLSLANMGSFNK